MRAHSVQTYALSTLVPFHCQTSSSLLVCTKRKTRTADLDCMQCANGASKLSRRLTMLAL